MFILNKIVMDTKFFHDFKLHPRYYFLDLCLDVRDVRGKDLGAETNPKAFGDHVGINTAC